jgi:rifampicin phosphotransferase
VQSVQRELVKFVWPYPLSEIRRQLLLARGEQPDRGTIHEADDVMFLTLSEAAEAAAGLITGQTVTWTALQV